MLFTYWQYFIDLLDLRTVISLLSATISATSLYFTRRFWLEANRPIISVSIVSYEPGNISTAYNIVIYNTGNRPATFIKLHVEKEALDKIIIPNANQSLTKLVYRCFSDEAVIPLLINGKEISNSFGITSARTEDNLLKYNSELPISISYSDLENRKYRSKQVLVVRDSQVFAGGQWSKKD